MGLPNSLINKLLAATQPEKPKNKESTVYGTAKLQNGKIYVELDGSTQLTPVASSVTVKDGDRVTVLIKNHTASILGNMTHPSVDGDTVQDEVKETVKDVVNYYAQTADKENPPTTGWSTTSPTWINGLFIWMKTRTTLVSGKYTESLPVNITGATGDTGAQGPQGPEGSQGLPGVNGDKGDKGDPGQQGPPGENGTNGSNGVSILDIHEYYITASNGITVPAFDDPRWSEDLISPTSTLRYLWNYEKYDYSDSTVKRIKPRVIGVYGDTGQNGADGAQGPIGPPGANGTDGAPGDKGDTGLQGPPGADGNDGTSISGITVYYLATNSGSGVTHNTPGWTTAVQQTDASKRFLWMYEKIDYINPISSSKTQPAVIGTHGQNGADGTDGRTIVSIEDWWYLSTSSTSLSGGSWSKTPATFGPTTWDKWLWHKFRITYDKPAGTEDTPSALDGPWKNLKEEHANSVKEYVSKVTWNEEKDHIIAEFEESGGSNLGLNMRPKIDLEHWTSNVPLSLYSGGENTQGEYFYSGIWARGSSIGAAYVKQGSITNKPLATNREYSLSYWIYCNNPVTARLQIGDTDLYREDIQLKSGYQLIKRVFKFTKAYNNVPIKITILTHGSFELYIPWMVLKEGPATNNWIGNVFEIRTGKTKIDADGIDTYNGGFRARDSRGVIGFQATGEGYLDVLKKIRVGGRESDGYFEAYDSTGDMVAKVGRDGATFKDGKVYIAESVNAKNDSSLSTLGATDAKWSKKVRETYLRWTNVEVDTKHISLTDVPDFENMQTTSLRSDCEYMDLYTNKLVFSKRWKHTMTTANKLEIGSRIKSGTNVSQAYVSSPDELELLAKSTKMTIGDGNILTSAVFGSWNVGATRASGVSNLNAIDHNGWFAYNPGNYNSPGGYGVVLSLIASGDQRVQIAFSCSNEYIYKRHMFGPTWSVWKSIYVNNLSMTHDEPPKDE